jgi:hypothetical protein
MFTGKGFITLFSALVKGNKMRPFKLCFGKTLTFAEMLRGYFK